MNINGRTEMTDEVNRRGLEGESLARLRTAALVALVAGATGSLGLILFAARHAFPLLWATVLSCVVLPFVALALAHRASKGWSVPARATVHVLTLVLAVASLALYGDDALRGRREEAAYVYLYLPPASWLLIAIVVPIAALISRLRSGREGTSTQNS